VFRFQIERSLPPFDLDAASYAMVQSLLSPHFADARALWRAIKVRDFCRLFTHFSYAS
jgi:hypothetical protein